MITKYNKTAGFYGFSALIPWTLWLLVAWLSHQDQQSPALQITRQMLGIAGLAAPFAVALYYITRDPDLIRDFKSRFFNLAQVRLVYVLIAVFLIWLCIVAAQLLSLLLGHSLDQFQVSGQPSFTSSFLSPWMILILAPILEELAWHCYGTDTLRRKFNLFSTSMIFAVYWVIWHIPLSFIKGYYHSKVVAEGPIYALNFVFSLFVFVIIMNWLYYKTNRNILITILFHLSANISNEMFATHPDSKVIQTGLLLIFSVFILIKERNLFFNRSLDEDGTALRNRNTIADLQISIIERKTAASPDTRSFPAKSVGFLQDPEWK
ncbi:MAG: CPBP family intramembrane metalloprotease [Leptospiraceae bacterium]|nr:CPBP family intramembrane metalloprotease [Leptospiraceae bacterium]